MYMYTCMHTQFTNTYTYTDVLMYLGSRIICYVCVYVYIYIYVFQQYIYIYTHL